MRINTNVSSITAQESAVNTNNNLSSSLEKLSSGLRINKASDDASGLAIADKLRTQATSINQGVDNGNSAVSLLQIADKSMAEQSNILDTVKAKLIQANTDTTSADGREAIRKDIVKLLEQLDNIAKQTNYNGTTLLQASRGDDSASTGLSFQVGESDQDLITNTAIQSNTAGLAGSVTTLAATDTVSLETGDSDIFKMSAAASVMTFDTDTATDTNSISVSGTIGTITSQSTLTISNASASDVEKLREMIAATGADDDLIDNGDGTFTLGGGTDNAVDFGGYEFNSITLTADTAGETIAFTANAANDKFSVQNLGGDITGTVSGAAIDSGITLASLKNLQEGELTSELTDIYQQVVDTSISNLNSYRGDVGSTQNQVESAVRNLMTQATNVAAAESIIRDVDYAAESANFNKQNIISQAGSYAISQANAVSQNVLRLLQ